MIPFALLLAAYAFPSVRRPVWDKLDPDQQARRLAEERQRIRELWRQP
jgi:hypothetical protein